MIFFNFLTNPLVAFLSVTGEDIDWGDIIIFLVALLALPYVLLTAALWAGGLGFVSALIAGIVVYPFWLTGQSKPFFGGALLTGLLAVAGSEPLQILFDLGWSEASAIDGWLYQMSFSGTVLTFATVYFAVTWPLAGLRKAIVGR